MSRISILLFVFAAVSLNSLSTFAQQPRPDGPDRQKWFNEVRNVKHDFLAKELDLSKDQQKAFFEAYDEMEDRLNQLNAETRRIEESTLADADATDAELEAASQAVYELKGKECLIEYEYLDKFKKVLSPRQLLQLKSAERKFTQQLMNHHRRLKKNDDPNRKR